MLSVSTRDDVADPSPVSRVPAAQLLARQVLELLRAPRWLLTATLATLTVAVRWVAHTSAYDVYVDEYFYQQMGVLVAGGHLPPGDGVTMFVLHPPGFFILEAGWQGLTGAAGDQFGQVMACRQLQIVLSAVTAVGIFQLLDRLAERVPAVAATLIFAVDPFTLRQNGRVLLETAVMAFVVIGWLPILWAVRNAGARTVPAAVLGGGLLLGCATAVKDVSLFLSTLPLLVMLALRLGLGRRRAAGAVLASLLPYTLFMLATVAQGGAAQLWQAKTSGVTRLLGLSVTTGYNVPGAPSLLSVAWQQVEGFLPSYLVMATGTTAAAWLTVRGPRPEHRIIGMVTLCGAVLIGYGTLFATSEEHLFYLVFVPALLSLAVAIANPRHRPRLPASPAGPQRRWRRWRRAFLVGVLVTTLGLDLLAWVDTRSAPDDGQRRVVAWIRDHVPPGTTVAFVAGQTEFQLAGTPWPAVPLGEPAEMARLQVRYLVVLRKEVDQRYSEVSPENLAWYTARGREVFGFPSRSYGRVSVYTVDHASW